MKLSDYMSSKLFPMTTQEDELSPIDQMLIDSINFDALNRVKNEGIKFDTIQNQIWKELNQKIPAQKLLKKEAEKASEGWNYD